MRPYLKNKTKDQKNNNKKTLYKKGLVEWLKVKALNSSPSTDKKKKHHASGA
jgi:hypothetical protein